MKAKINEKCVGMIIGCGVGDAWGIPFETMKYKSICNLKLNDIQKTKYMTPKDVGNESKYIPRDHGPGDYTDDTQLTLSLMKSFVEWNGYHFEDLMKVISKNFVLELDRTTIGWGGGTKRSAKRLKNGKSYLESGNKTSLGCGVIMKIFPFALYYVYGKSNLSESEKIHQISTFCKMTHNTTPCLVTANLYVDFLIKVLQSPECLCSSEKREILLDYLIQQCLMHEAYFGLKFDLVSTRLKLMKENFENLNDEKLIEISKGGTCNNVNSFSMVVGILISRDPSYKSIQTAVLIGGDTDSNAAMVGSVIGSISLDLLPRKLLSGLNEIKNLMKSGKEFSQWIHENKPIFNAKSNEFTSKRAPVFPVFQMDTQSIIQFFSVIVVVIAFFIGMFFLSK